MNSSNTTTGGYAESEMKTTTLPALVDALPSWLKSRLKTFSVLASAGGDSLDTVETVTGNKLALRSEVEVFGAISLSHVVEGTQVPYYESANTRIKTKGLSGGAADWWERSAGTAEYFCLVHQHGTATYAGASYAYGLAPFGCL